MAEFSENRHISNLINMSCKVLLMNPDANANLEQCLIGFESASRGQKFVSQKII